MGPEKEPCLPPGYRLDRSDPDLWTLRRSGSSRFLGYAQRTEPY
jgi:hypothetical protein